MVIITFPDYNAPISMHGPDLTQMNVFINMWHNTYLINKTSIEIICGCEGLLTYWVDNAAVVSIAKLLIMRI